MKAYTYEPASGIGKTGQNLKDFGTAQNELNAVLLERTEALIKQNEVLMGQLSAALERIALLEAEQEKNLVCFSRCAAELEAQHKEIDRLRLTAKLNTNAIDRLTKEK